LRPQQRTPEALTPAQQSKAKIARAEAEAASSPSSNLPPSSFCLSSAFGRRSKTPPTHSTWTEAAAAWIASAAARKWLSRAWRRQPTTRRRGALRGAWRGASRCPSPCPHGSATSQSQRRSRRGL